MSTAILMSGQMRSFSQCYPTQRWQVYRHYPDCHFFLVVQNNEQVKSIDLLRRDYGEERVHAFVIDDPVLPEIPQHYGAHAPYANAAPHNRLLLQHWYQLQVWEFYRLCGKTTGNDTFIRMRPDNWMQSFEDCVFPRYALEEKTMEPFVYSPWWGRFGSGINDRLAIMGPKAASAYFTLYNSIQSLLDAGCPFHPETLLAAHLERSGIKVNHTLNAMFGTLRLPRQDPTYPAQTLNRYIQEMRFPEILPHESAEYARNK